MRLLKSGVRCMPVVIGRLYVADTFALTQLKSLVIFNQLSVTRGAMF